MVTRAPALAPDGNVDETNCSSNLDNNNNNGSSGTPYSMVPKGKKVSIFALRIDAEQPKCGSLGGVAHASPKTLPPLRCASDFSTSSHPQQSSSSPLSTMTTTTPTASASTATASPMKRQFSIPRDNSSISYTMERRRTRVASYVQQTNKQTNKITSCLQRNRAVLRRPFGNFVVQMDVRNFSVCVCVCTFKLWCLVALIECSPSVILHIV